MTDPDAIKTALTPYLGRLRRLGHEAGSRSPYKLASILHRMWVSETDFKVGFGARVTRRLRLRPVQ